MMKSQVNALLHVAHGIVKDVVATYPALESSLSKDIGRIALYSRERGLGLWTLDLPHLESHLLAALERGRLVLDGPLSTRVSKSVRVPRLYSGLWLRIFEKDASLKQDVDVTALFFLRQLLVLGKKMVVDCSYDRRQATVGAYHDIERGLRSPSMGWTFDNLDNGIVLSDLHSVQALEDPRSGTPIDLPLFSPRGEEAETPSEPKKGDRYLLNQAQRVADLVIGTFDLFDPLLVSYQLESEGHGIGFRHGPGAVSEQLKNWEKSQFPNWPNKLEGTFPFAQCGTTALSYADRPSTHEKASRLIAVPKTAKRPRLIAAEPTSHQWCQQLLLAFLFRQCKRHFRGAFIDFKDQSKSGRLVLRASRDRKLATVDLSDASDRLSCWTVERLFRCNPSVLKALHAARTRYMRDEVSDVPNFLSLKKFASQGTATTFPVMSLVMLFLALGSVIEGEVTWKSIWKLRTQVRVFGDDIIIPSHGYERLLRLMELHQLKVNVAKSYVAGYFRESCGTDGYMGHCVTPVKPETLVADSPASCQAVMDTTNNLFNKGLWHASDSCRTLLPARIQRAIRIVGANDAGYPGLRSFSGSDESHLIRRWNSRLHRYEVRVWTTLVRTQKRDRDGFPALLDFFASKYNHEHARIVSEYRETRKARDGFLWEPVNPGALVTDGH